jgi:hypothetical protein
MQNYIGWFLLMMGPGLPFSFFFKMISKIVASGVCNRNMVRLKDEG